MPCAIGSTSALFYALPAISVHIAAGDWARRRCLRILTSAEAKTAGLVGCKEQSGISSWLLLYCIARCGRRARVSSFKWPSACNYRWRRVCRAVVVGFGARLGQNSIAARPRELNAAHAPRVRADSCGDGAQGSERECAQREAIGVHRQLKD